MKEKFCPACLAIPLAFTGGGAAAVSENFENPNWGLIIGIMIIIISIMIYLYYKRKCRNKSQRCY